MANLCIYGAGAIGCYLGGRLLAAGCDVTFVGRARMADELRAHGLTLSTTRAGTGRSRRRASGSRPMPRGRRGRIWCW